MHEQFIEVEGWRTRYVCAGQSGPVLVLIHGLGTSLESWQLNIEALARDFRVYALDLLYFGKSAKPPQTPTFAFFSRFVCAFMDALDIAGATLIGNSMGGAIAARTALDAPERVERLVLVDPAGFGREVAWWLRLRSVWDVRPRGKPAPWLLRLGLKGIFFNPDRVPPGLVDAVVALNADPGVIEAYRRVIRLGVDWRGLKASFLQEIRDRAHHIRVPTLLVWGRQDRVVPLQHLATAQQNIPHARVCVFDQCGHAPQIEHPEKFNALVREFVRETNLYSFAAPHLP